MLTLTSIVNLWCWVFTRIIAVGLFALFGATAHAEILQFRTTALGGDLWRYDYTLQGQAPSGGFDGLTIYFEPTAFGQLTSVVAPSDWDPLLVQPDTGLPADGFVDLLYLGGLLGGSVGPVEFSVDVEYFGSLSPGSQRFELYASDPFAVVVSGETQRGFAVPEPATVALVALALSFVVSRQFRATRRIFRVG